MQGLLKLSHWLDRIGYRCGQLANVMILASCFISASNAMIRYGFDWSSNALLEMQWYLFGAAVMLGASYTFQRNEHVRVDLIYGHVSERAQLWIDVFGIIVFLFPACILFAWLSWESLFMPSWGGGAGRALAGSQRTLRSAQPRQVPVTHLGATVRCGQDGCFAVNPADARFCRRCGRGLPAAQRVNVRRAAVW